MKYQFEHDKIEECRDCPMHSCLTDLPYGNEWCDLQDCPISCDGRPQDNDCPLVVSDEPTDCACGDDLTVTD